MGGAGGHMWHPFDCPDVNSGQDLIDFFRKSINAIKRNPAALKIDGVNLSFRLKENPGSPSGYEFVIDRGSMSPLDMEGVTSATADQRFVTKDGSPHGMVEATNILLSIFNAAIPDIMPELQDLGMLENMGPFSRYFNTEFVLKKINVKEYPFNFIAIHGVNKFEPTRYPDDYEKKPELAGQIRYKKDGKTPSSKFGMNVEYDQGTVDRLSDKVQSFASQQDFKTYTKIPADVKKSVLIEDALNEQFTITYKSYANDPEEPGELGAGEGSTKPIKAWLAGVASNPVNKKVNISGHMREMYPNMGRSQTPYAKNIYIEVLKGTSIADIAAGPEDVEAIVDAVVVMHSTRLLGNAVLDALESDEFGSAREQEGVVVEDPEICGGTAFKFTGDFIVGGLASTFEEAKYRSGPLLESFMPEPINLKEEEQNQENKQFVILVPGGFKPPTGGHYHMIKHYDKKPDVRKVFVITGPRARGGVTLDQSREIFSIYGGFSDKVEFKVAPWINPEDEEEERRSKGPMTACYELMEDPNFVNQFTNLHFSIGASEKEDDEKRIKDFIKYFTDNPGVSQAKISYYPPSKAFEVDGEPASATRMRKAFEEQDWETFKKLLPHPSLYDDVVQVLSNTTEQEGGNLQENFFTLGSLFSLVNEIYSEKQRRFMCAQAEKPAAARPEGLSGSEAEEMCKSEELNEEETITEEAKETIQTMAAGLIAKVLTQTQIKNVDVKKIGAPLVDKITNLINSVLQKTADGAQGQQAAQDKARDAYDQLTTEEAENLEEMSAMAAGNVGGFAAPLGEKDDERQRKKA
mgnify:CR=1 FL=1